MAFSSRNSLLNFFLIIGIGLTFFFIVNVAFFLIYSSASGSIDFFETHPFWFVYDAIPYGYVSSILGMVLMLVMGFLSFYFFRIFFKRVGQAEIFFFSLFLFSLLPETLRLTVLNLQFFNLTPLLGIILTRTVLGSRIFGLLCLFFGSLYMLDFQYQKFEMIVAVVFVCSFLLAFSIPFDSHLLLTDGLFKLSDEQGFFIIYSSLFLFLIVNYIISILRGKIFLIPIGIILLVIAKEIFLFALTPIHLVLGGVVFIGGTMSTYKGFQSSYNFP